MSHNAIDPNDKPCCPKAGQSFGSEMPTCGCECHRPPQQTPQNADWNCEQCGLPIPLETDIDLLIIDVARHPEEDSYLKHAISEWKKIIRSKKKEWEDEAEKRGYGRGVADGLNSTAPQDPKLREIWSRLYEGKELPHQP